MARKERNSADYFPHIIGSGRKMFVIERKFGNDGYASWFKILETLAITEYHFIDLSHEDQLIYLAAKCNVEEDLLIKILDELSKIDAINKFLWSKKIVWSDYFIENIADAYLRRNNKCIQFEDLCIRLGINCIRYVNGLEGNVYINPHTKVEYIIVDNTIPKETKPKPPKAGVSEAIIYPSFDDFWNAYDKKVDRAETEKKWSKLNQTEKEKIMLHVARYVVSTPNAQYRKNPTTYLNQKTYLDEIVIPQQNGNATTKPTAADRHRESVIKAVNEINAGVDIPRADDIFRLPPPVKNSQ